MCNKLCLRNVIRKGQNRDLATNSITISKVVNQKVKTSLKDITRVVRKVREHQCKQQKPHTSLELFFTNVSSDVL